MSEAGTSSAHVGLMKLRQLRAGELGGDEAQAVRAHAEGCADCRGKLQGLEDEQARFQAAVSFDRFAAGVERAARSHRAPRVRRWMAPVMAVAAALVVVVAAGRVLSANPGQGQGGWNHVKGGPEIALRIAGPSGASQREAPDGTPALLSPGERVRIGYRAVQHRFVTVLSVDQQGDVTPIYPERGESLPASNASAMVYLPESLEFTGSGAERVIVILSDEPLQVSAAVDATRKAYRAAGGELSRMAPLQLPGEQFFRMVQKP
jgi:putative zinc finger protein